MHACKASMDSHVCVVCRTRACFAYLEHYPVLTMPLENSIDLGMSTHHAPWLPFTTCVARLRARTPRKANGPTAHASTARPTAVRQLVRKMQPCAAKSA
eukprot:1171011-Lingulodinium_polyedra.AAC.1